MVKKILSILLWVITAAAIVVLFIFARENYLTMPLKSINLITETDTGFVRKTELQDELLKICNKSRNIGTVDMMDIQKHLGENPWIETNASYIDLNGVLNVNFEEYQPQFRVWGKQGGSVYVTQEGVVVPSSTTYTPYVLIASGNFDLIRSQTAYYLNDTIPEDINYLNALHWSKAIGRNPFISNCVGQLYCNSKNQFELTMRGIDARVIVGDTCDASDKPNRLEIFIKQKINSNEIHGIKSINLNYKNQIVCTKR